MYSTDTCLSIQSLLGLNRSPLGKALLRSTLYVALIESSHDFTGQRRSAWQALRDLRFDGNSSGRTGKVIYLASFNCRPFFLTITTCYVAGYRFLPFQHGYFSAVNSHSSRHAVCPTGIRGLLRRAFDAG